MYMVMKAIYDSGMPISFKGSMVLKACLMEAGYDEETRHTVDIDANWNSEDSITAEQILESLQLALDESDLKLDLHIYRFPGEKRSAGFEVLDRATKEVLFTMDIDVNRPVPETRIYEIEGIRFRGASPAVMIADKVASISTDKVFRRIKDVVDLYYISKVFEFDLERVYSAIKDSGRDLGDFNGFLYRVADLDHSYQKFRFSGGVNKPSFEQVYEGAKSFVSALIPHAID